MDKRTADALEASITHWQENIAAETPEAINVYNDGCALCALFLPESEEEENCIGCPVFARTGRHGCWGTPWSRARDSLERWKNYPEARDAWRRAAHAELDFLISLREIAP